MNFTEDNRIVQLCAKGIELEGQGEFAAARDLFNEAWTAAATDFEKLTAAHYVARHQRNVSDKLTWDKIALQHALRINDAAVRETLPSLHLNIGKGYEDLREFETAATHYRTGLSFAGSLPDNGYGRMIEAGLQNGLERVGPFS